MSYVKYKYEKLYELAVEMFVRYGYSKEDSAKIADVILTSDRLGVESHGVNRLVLYPFGIDIGRIKVDAPREIVEETPVSAVIDAHDGMGQLASIMGMEIAIKKAKTTGIGMVTVRNSNHFGIAGYYSMMAAKEGFMGISMTNAEALVVPTFGRRPMMGTNPIAVTIPATPNFFHMDFSTSVRTAGSMEVYAKRGATLKEGMLIDENGVTSTDPQKFLEIRRTKSLGGIMPLGGEGMMMGGHKGYGLGLLVDIMTGIFSHGAVSTGCRAKPDKEKVCHFFGAIDYAIFGGKQDIEEKLSAHMQAIRDSEKAQGQDRIFVHGDKEVEAEKEVLAHGVGINEATLAEINKYCSKLGINSSEYLISAE